MCARSQYEIVGTSVGRLESRDVGLRRVCRKPSGADWPNARIKAEAPNGSSLNLVRSFALRLYASSRQMRKVPSVPGTSFQLI